MSEGTPIKNAPRQFRKGRHSSFSQSSGTEFGRVEGGDDEGTVMMEGEDEWDESSNMTDMLILGD